MKLELVAFTAAGCALGRRLAEKLTDEGETARLFNAREDKSQSVDEWTERGFHEADALVFIGAAGIAVRKIAPFVRSKLTDPAVVVLDEKGQFSISLLSGHAGGANDLAVRLARLVDAIPVVTTATDVNGLFAVDSWAVKQGLVIENPGKIKWVSGRLLAGETIRIRSEFPIAGTPPKGVELVENEGYDVLITCRTKGTKDALRLVPRCLFVGMGARRGIAFEAVQEGFDAALRKGSLDPRAVCAVCTVDLKAKEAALLELCRQKELPLKVFTAGELLAVPGSFSSSEFVRSVTGVDNVCERSAVLGSGGGRLLLKKNAGNGVTAAVAASDVKLSF